VQFNRDGTEVVSTSADGTARVWPLNRVTPSSAPDGRSDYEAERRFSPDGTREIVPWQREDGFLTRAAVRATQTGKVIHVLDSHLNAILSCTFSPDGNRAATTSWDNTAKLWDAHSGQLLHTLSGQHHQVHSAVFHPDGKRLATASDHISIWDVETGTELLVLRHKDVRFERVRFSKDGSRLAGLSSTGTTVIFDSSPVNIAFNVAIR
jgi:WD40 repeat protein